MRRLRRAFWWARMVWAGIEAHNGVPGARFRLAKARAGYCATFPPGVRFIWRD